MKLHVIDQKPIRAENKKKILQLLITKREMTILEISRELDVSIPTVTKNINQLIEEGLAVEAGFSSSTGGRRPMVIKFQPNAYYSFGVEFSTGRYVRIILTNLDSDIIAEDTLKNPDFHQFDDVMQAIHRQINSLLHDANIPLKRVLGLGFSLPGTVNEENRFLKIAPNLGLKHLDFSHYETIFGMPLFLENDANAAAMAELTLGIAKSMQNLVFLDILPQGIGGGIVVGGHLFQGKNKRAGEFSHMLIASEGRQCTCGRKDCWELYVSINALFTSYQQKTGTNMQSLAEFFACLNNKEPTAVEIFDEYLDYLAAGIQNIILIQDPHYVIIGGEFSLFEDCFIKPLQEKVFVENDFYSPNDVKIMCSNLKERASVLGASLLPLERMFARHDV